MLCTTDPDDQQYCIPLSEDPKIIYNTEKECIINSLVKKKQIMKTARKLDMNVTGIYSTCISEGNPVRVPISF